MAQYQHIEIMREKIVEKYRFQQNRNPPRPPMRDNKQYGLKLKNDLSKTLQSIRSNRLDVGIQSENLMVLEIVSDAMSPDLLENMLRKFNIYLVEETALPNTNKSRLFIQFQDMSSLNIFDHERELWENDDHSEAILSYAKRRDLFRCIDNIRSVSREDRTGVRLKKLLDDPILFPNEFFIVNIDVWFNGERSNVIEIENQIRQVLGNQGSKLMGDLFKIPSMLLGRALVNEFSLNALLNMDIISSVEIPVSNVSTEQYELYTQDFDPIIKNNLDDNAPLATILDSGIFTGNPLLSDVVVGEEEFDTTENTTTDLNGHGTGVAGIVVYGDFNECLKTNSFNPLVRICNGKIMHDENGNPCFPQDKRPEQIIKEAIEYFHKEYGCRVFNLSAGDSDHLYNGGRQFAWAELLDQLSRSLDIVIVVSAGNVSDPQIDEFISREELMTTCRDQLFNQEHRLIDPATSALSVTVGSITRFEDPEAIVNRASRLSVGKKDYMSVFTRIGRGVNRAIKPELVDYGGNFAVHQPVRGQTRWMKTDLKLVEPTLHNDNDKIFKGYCGTSFSAPHVTHLAARIERALEEQIKQAPSANLIRAVLVNSARCTSEMVEWAEQSKDPLYTGKTNPKQDRKLRLIGFGRANDSLLYSDNNRVTLFAEDKLELRSFHMYKIPVPKKFLEVKAEKTISVSLAYNPITKLSRKDYLTNNLWFEVFKKIDEETILQYKSRKKSGEDEENDLKNLPNTNKADFSPGYTELLKGTLQQRIWQKGVRGGSDLLWDENDPYIYIIVTGKERFKYAEQELPQDYALAITFSFSGKQDIQLYNSLKNNVRTRGRTTRQQERIRTQFKS